MLRYKKEAVDMAIVDFTKAFVFEKINIEYPPHQKWQNNAIGLYRENAIAIESKANNSFGSPVYYITMQITLPIPEFT